MPLRCNSPLRKARRLRENESIPKSHTKAQMSRCGKARVVIGLNGAGGILLLDLDGKQVWAQPEGNVWHVELLDINEDGRKEILNSDARGQLLVRDANGAILSRYSPGQYVSDFSLTRWGTESEPHHILIPFGKYVSILDAQGHIVTRLDEPLGISMTGSSGTSVEFSPGNSDYALLQNNWIAKRAVLTLYDQEGQIAYQEILADACSSIAAMPDAQGSTLLVGCADTACQYAAHTATKGLH